MRKRYMRIVLTVIVLLIAACSSTNDAVEIDDVSQITDMEVNSSCQDLSETLVDLYAIGSKALELGYVNAIYVGFEEGLRYKGGYRVRMHAAGVLAYGYGAEDTTATGETLDDVRCRAYEELLDELNLQETPQYEGEESITIWAEDVEKIIENVSTVEHGSTIQISSDGYEGFTVDLEVRFPKVEYMRPFDREDRVIIEATGNTFEEALEEFCKAAEERTSLELSCSNSA